MYAEKQTKHIDFRVSETDYQKIKQSADLYGMSIGQYSKLLIQKSRLKKPKFTYQETLAIKAELHHIGNNINQLARSLNRLNKYLTYNQVPQNLPDSQLQTITETRALIIQFGKKVEQLWQRLS